jgi:NAD(P)-dependent dehydrogenase (short-subunit alcohol dehydrogenase family)
MNPEQSFRLEGARAVVTGAASGIGNAIARTFHAAGASVFLLDLHADAAQAAAQAIGPQAVAIPCDVSDEQSVAQAFAHIAQTGPTSILVNSAGVAHIGTVLNTPPEDFDRLFRINVRGTYLCMAAAAPQMRQANAGVILNLASIAATSGLPDRFAYSMTKGAVLSMTLSAARDLLPFHIRCNCISPARVHTPFVDGFLARTYPGREQEMFEVLSKSQPIGRMGTPDEIALLALYLCSPAAAFITGADYPIDGGFFNLR